MSSASHVATIAFVILLAICAASLRGGGTEAFFSDSEAGDARFTGNVPIATCAAFWANSTERSALKITGSDHIFDGCVHSNGGFDLGGARDTFNRTIRHAGEYRNNTNGHVVRSGVVAVTATPYAYPYAVEDYQPTGCKAQQAANRGAYFSYVGSTVQIKGALLRPGLHYVQGDAVADLTNFAGNITIVATGKVNVGSGVLGARAYIDSLLGHAGASGPNALSFTGNGGVLVGSLLAPNGEVSFSAQANDYSGQVMGHTITVSGAESVFHTLAHVSYQPCA